MASFKADIIDADAHVVETDRVWDYLDASEKKYRPTLVTAPHNPQRQFWVLDGENLGDKFPSPNEKQSENHFKRFGREVATPVKARELSDVKQRLRHMDELGIDVQVLYFLRRRTKSRHRHRLRPRRHVERAQCNCKVQSD